MSAPPRRLARLFGCGAEVALQLEHERLLKRWCCGPRLNISGGPCLFERRIDFTRVHVVLARANRLGADERDADGGERQHSQNA